MNEFQYLKVSHSHVTEVSKQQFIRIATETYAYLHIRYDNKRKYGAQVLQQECTKFEVGWNCYFRILFVSKILEYSLINTIIK